jgi:hypothetical protein
MRRDHVDADSAARATDGDGAAVWTEAIERIAAERAACEALGDPELARRAGRKLIAAIACASDAILADEPKILQSAPEKLAAFFDKSAAGYVQAIDGLSKRAALAEATAGHGIASARPRAVDAPPAFPPWRSPARE